MAVTMPAEVSEAPEAPVRAPRVTSLDDFARITARLEGGASRDEVLSDEGLTDTEWLGIQREWLSRMADLACHGRRQLHGRFLERVSAVAEEAAQVPAPGDDRRPRTPAPRIIIAARKPLQLKANRSVEPSPGPRIGSSAPPPLVSPRNPPVEGRSLFETTVEARVDPALLKSIDEALPFKASGETPKSSLPRGISSGLPFAPVPDDREDDLAGGTLDGASDTDDLLETLDGSRATPAAALPFAAELSSTLDTKLPVGDSSWPFPRAERATNDAAGRDPYVGLPFARSEVPAPPSTPPAGGTHEIAPSPFPDERGRHGRGAAPTVSLEQYAWLTSLLARSPEREQETLAWLHLTPERKVVVDAHFTALFQRDPQELTRYRQLREHYDAQ